MKLQDKAILITGASSGIGKATALLLAQKGARLALVARRKDALHELATEIQKNGGLGKSANKEPIVIAADVTNPKDRARIYERIAQQWGKLSVLINNAGITAHGRFEDTKPEVLRKTMELNFFSAVELTSLLLPLMKETSGTKGIVFVSTPSGLYGIPERFAYSASKAAGHAWMESLRLELKDEGFFASIVCPGYTRTALRTSGLSSDGSRLQEEQAKSAKTPEFMARRILLAIEKERRLVLTDTNGRFVYLLRTLAPGLLESILHRKLLDSSTRLPNLITESKTGKA